jgi:stearoyl-CoA desaturase (delta-9 desaturase)
MFHFVFWFVAGSLLLAVIPNQMAVNSTTVYLHRALTHRSLELRAGIEWLYRFAIWITTGIVPQTWAAVHRKHHAFTDQSPDPHSPYHRGFWNVQLGNVFLYMKASKEPDLLQTYAKDIRPDEWDRGLFSRPAVGLGLGIAAIMGFGFLVNSGGWWLAPGGFWLNGIAGAGMGLAGAAIHAVSYVFLQSSSVNGLCHTPHRWGYRLSAAKHAATTFNNVAVALFTGGEGLHHNHHWMQSSARFARAPLELLVDSGWWSIWVMKQLRLAHHVRVAPLLR